MLYFNRESFMWLSVLKSGVFILSLSFCAFAENLLQNPGFESGVQGWNAWGSEPTKEAQTGSGALLVHNKEPKWSGADQTILLPPGVNGVVLSGFMKTQKVMPGTKPWENARLSIEYVNEGGQVHGGYPSVTGQATGDTDWKSYSKTYPLFEGAYAVKVNLALGNGTGQVFFDEISLNFLKEDGTQFSLAEIKTYQAQQNKQTELWFKKSLNALHNGGFESGAEGWNFWGGVEDKQKKSGKKALKVHNTKATWSGADQKILLPSNTFKILVGGYIRTQDVVMGKENWEQARISVEFHDHAGNMVGGYPPVTGQFYKTNDWTWVQQTYFPPEGAKSLKVTCALGNAMGTAWFDDLKVVLAASDQSVLKPLQVTGPMDEGKWYAYPTAKGKTGSHFVDWSGLLDAPAGKHGFLQVKEGKFVFENGTPVKFWGTNLVAKDIFASHQEMDSLASRLAKMGANMLRLHHMDAPWSVPNIFGNKKGTRSLDSAALDRLDYLIYAMKNKGIYIFMDLLVHREFTPEDGVDQPMERGGKMTGFFNEKSIELQKEFATQLLTHYNPYTKLQYKDDPAIAASEFINESSLYTHFSGDALSPYYRQELQNKFLEIPAHKDKKLSVFGMEYSGHRATLRESVVGDTRASLDFITATEKKYYQTLNSHLRSLGVKYPLAGSNFPPPILAALHNNTDLDFIITNEYWDHPQVWKINDDWDRVLWAPFDNNPQLKNLAWTLVRSKSWFRVKDKPFMITEWNHCYPNEYVLEGVPLISAYGALQGWNGILEFDIRHGQQGEERITNISLSRKPEDMAHWVMAAPAFLGAYIKEAPGEVIEGVRPDQVQELPSYSDFLETNYHLPYITKVSKSFAQKSSQNHQQFNKFWDSETKVAKSETGELTLDGKKGWLEFSAAKLQGAVGFIKDHSFNLQDISFQVKNSHASVLAVSADQKDLSQSSSIYLVVTGPTKMTSQTYSHTRNSLKDIGKLPVLAQVIEGELSLKQGDWEIYSLSPAGEKGKKMKTEKVGEGTLFKLDQGRSHVYLAIRK
jgi:hypothetical protein